MANRKLGSSFVRLSRNRVNELTEELSLPKNSPICAAFRRALARKFEAAPGYNPFGFQPSENLGFPLARSG
jgi:hypothetical protein